MPTELSSTATEALTRLPDLQTLDVLVERRIARVTINHQPINLMDAINLLYADLTGLPPTMVYYGTGEILVGEIIEFAQRAKHAGVDISLHTVPEGQHSFIMGAGRVPEADEAIEQMGRWVRSRLNLDDMRHSVMSTS